MSIVLILAIPLLSIVGVETGTLYITTQPGEAAVYIDGIYKGTTPIYNEYDIQHLTIQDIPIGSHTIKISKTGYYDWNNTKQISSGAETINAFLEIMKGTLEIYTEMGFGEVYIDGISKGLAGWDAPLSIYVPYGTHDISITYSGCKEWKQTVQIQKQVTTIRSSFNCTVGIEPVRKGAEISFPVDIPSIAYTGSTLDIYVIVTNTGVNDIKHNFPVEFSLLDPYGNWTNLPYRTVTLNPGDTTHVYYTYDIPPSGPAGTWAVKAAVWDRTDENGTLQTRYDYEEKTFNVSGSGQNISISSVPAEPVTVATPTGKIIVAKVIGKKFGQSNLKINAGDEVVWDNGDTEGYVLIEMDKKIANITLPFNGNAKYIFNTSGDYRLTLNYYNIGRISPVIQNIIVIPPIQVSTPSLTVTSPSITPTITIAQITTATPTTIPIPPTSKSPAFEVILSGIGIITAFLLRRR